MSRTCKKCGSVDYDIWGYIGLIGYSLLFGAMGYSIALVINNPILIIIGAVLGIILMVPMWFISFHEEKEIKEE